MTNGMKKMVMGSMVVSGLVALTAVIDIVIGIPFSGQKVMDIMFIVSAGVVLYLGYETYKEMS